MTANAVERVARALFALDAPNGDPDEEVFHPIPEFRKKKWELYKRQAEAAIAALTQSQPTDASANLLGECDVYNRGNEDVGGGGLPSNADGHSRIMGCAGIGERRDAGPTSTTSGAARQALGASDHRPDDQLPADQLTDPSSSEPTDALIEALEEQARIGKLAIIQLAALEEHCQNKRHLRGADHADEGARIRRAIRCFLPTALSTFDLSNDAALTSVSISTDIEEGK